MTDTGQVNEASRRDGGEPPVMEIAERLAASGQVAHTRPAEPRGRGAGGGFAVYRFAFAAEKKPAIDPGAIATCVAKLGQLNGGIEAYVARNAADPPSLEEVAKQDSIPACPSGRPIV